MLNPSRTLTALAIAASFGVGAAHTQAHAALIAEEYFDYGSADLPLAQRNGGTGWDGQWDNSPATTAYDADLNLTANITGYSNAGNVGGSATLGSGSTNIHSRKLDTSATTVWFSAVVNIDAATDRVLFWIDSTPAQVNSGDFIGVNNGNAAFRYNSPNVTQTGPAASTTEPFLILAKAELDVSGQNDRLSYWFAPTDVTSEASLGTATFTSASADTFDDSIGGIALQFAGGSSTPGSIDAIRVGTELSDVTAFVIPEPASLALLGLGSVLIAGRRRR